MSFETMMHAAHAEQPKTIEKVAMMLQLTERLDPESLKETVEEMKTIADFAKEKMAAVNPAMINGAKAFGTSMGVTLAAGLGTAVATDLYDAARRGLTKARNLRRIMDANPELREITKGKDQQSKLRMSYNALSRYAPDFTADPLVGGAILKSLVETDPQSAPGVIRELISARKTLLDARNSQFKPMNLHIPEKKESPDLGKAEQQRFTNQLKIEKFRHDLRESENRGKALRGSTPKE